MEHTRRLIDYEAIKDNEPLNVGDHVRLNGQLYYVSEVTYESGVNTVPTIRYELELLQPLITHSDEMYDRMVNDFGLNHISLTSLMVNKIRPPQEEEISPETRKEFMKLLE